MAVGLEHLGQSFLTHVDESGNAPDGIVGMQGTEDQVSREGGPNRDINGFHVAHLAHHDHVGVAAKDAAKGPGKGEVDLGFDGDLDHSVYLVLDGILDGDDAAFLYIE